MIGVRQTVRVDGEVVSEKIESAALTTVTQIESVHDITILGQKRRIEIEIEFDQPLAPERMV